MREHGNEYPLEALDELEERDEKWSYFVSCHAPQPTALFPCWKAAECVRHFWCQDGVCVYDIPGAKTAFDVQ